MFMNEGVIKIKKYPFIKQQGIKECGPVCVQMILKYYGGYAGIEKLSEMMNTNHRGTTAYDLIKTLNEIGFKSEGLKLDKIEKINTPCIVHVVINSYTHYMVIYEINLKKNFLIVADPASYLKKISFQEFKEIWTGVVIEMHPLDKVICDYEPKVYKYIFYYIKRNIKLIVLISCLALMVNILSIFISLFVPFMMKTPLFELDKVVLCFAIIFLIRGILNFIQNRSLIKLNKKLDENISKDIFHDILSLPYCYYKRKKVGEITSYFSQLYLVRNFISLLASTAFIDGPLLLITIIIIFTANRFIFALNILCVFVLIFLYKHYSQKNYIFISETQRKKGLVNSFMVETINNFETIKNLNIFDKIYADFDKIYNSYTFQTYKLNNLYNKESLLKELIYGATLFLIMLVSFKLCHSDMSMFVSQFIISTIFISTFRSVIDLDLNFKEAMSALKRLIELSSYKSENKEKKWVNGNIQISNLSFSYGKKVILKNLNLYIKCESKVFVSGPSGSGKSTLFKILKGYYNYGGSVKIGNFEVLGNEISSISYVSQGEKLFTGTINDNLNVKGDNIFKNNICYLDDILFKNKIIEEDGFNLSGGQKQRIVLARALENFEILVIDEGLSQVSVDLERKILKKLFNKFNDKTIIYISHRLDNLDLFDQFVFIKKGRVVRSEVRNN